RDFHVTGVQTCALPISGVKAPCVTVVLIWKTQFVKVYLPVNPGHLQARMQAGSVRYIQAVSQREVDPLCWHCFPGSIVMTVVQKIGRASCRERRQNVVG